MWPFKQEETIAIGDKMSEITVLRVLTNPLYDTEWVVPKGPESLELMVRPIGQANTLGNTKTEVDTNMVCVSCLPTPMKFDWYRLRTEFSPDVSFEEILAYRFASRLGFRFGERQWFSYPLSFVPFTAYRGIEEIRQIAPVLCSTNSVERFQEAWDKADIVEAGKEPAAAKLLKDPRGIYRTEEARMVTLSGERDLRIRSNENFTFTVTTNWDAPLALPKKNFAIRLYMEGLLYSSPCREGERRDRD